MSHETCSNKIRTTCPRPCLGIVRLDGYPLSWDGGAYEPAPGDVDHPISYDYPVKYCIAPNCTFDYLCDPDKFLNDENLKKRMEDGIKQAIQMLEQAGCNVITADCGLFMWFQDYARQVTKKPVIMSSLAMLPSIFQTLDGEEEVAVFTSNANSLNRLKDTVLTSMLGDDAKRLVVVGCDGDEYGKIDGFEAVAEGTKVDVEKVRPGMVSAAQTMLEQNPDVTAIIVECTEIPPYSDSIRQATGLPVYDPITICDNFMAGFQKQGFTAKYEVVQTPRATQMV